MDTQCFNSISHRVSCSNSRQVCQSLQYCALIGSLFEVWVIWVSSFLWLSLLGLTRNYMLLRKWGVNVLAYTWVTLVRTLADISFVLNWLRTSHFDFLVTDVVVKLLLTLQLLLVMNSCSWVVLFAWLVSTYKRLVLLQLDLRDLLEHLLWLLPAWKVLWSSLIPVLHALRYFFPHPIVCFDVAWDLHIVGFVILFAGSSETYKVSLVFIMSCSTAYFTNWWARYYSVGLTTTNCSYQTPLKNLDPLLFLCCFLLYNNLLFRDTCYGYLTLRFIICDYHYLVLGLLLITCSSLCCWPRGNTCCTLIILVWSKMFHNKLCRKSLVFGDRCGQ